MAADRSQVQNMKDWKSRKRSVDCFNECDEEWLSAMAQERSDYKECLSDFVWFGGILVLCTDRGGGVTEGRRGSVNN